MRDALIGRPIRDIDICTPMSPQRVTELLEQAGLKAVRSEVTDAATGEHRSYSGQSALEWNAAFTQDLPEWNATWGVNLSGFTDKTAYRFDGSPGQPGRPPGRIATHWQPARGAGPRSVPSPRSS